VLHLDVRRQDQDRGVRVLLADLVGGVQAFGGVGRRHPDIDDDQLGPLLADHLKKPRRIAGLADHVEARTFEQAGHALP